MTRHNAKQLSYAPRYSSELDIYVGAIGDENADTMLAAQLPHANRDSPERRLLVSVLYSAIRSACGPRKVVRDGPRCRERWHGHRTEAHDWIASDARSCEYFTFLDVCDYLELQPEALRSRLRSRKRPALPCSVRVQPRDVELRPKAA